jgi:hypothetical protein
MHFVSDRGNLAYVAEAFARCAAAAVLAIFYVAYSLWIRYRRAAWSWAACSATTGCCRRPIAGIAGSGYDNFARRYARILARDGIDLEIRNTAGAVENLDLLRDPASKVQAALTTLGFAPGRYDASLTSTTVFPAKKVSLTPASITGPESVPAMNAGTVVPPSLRAEGAKNPSISPSCASFPRPLQNV